MSIVSALEGNGHIGIEYLGFFEPARYNQQSQDYYSSFLDYELFHSLDDEQEFKAKVFFRSDAQSESRDHFDVREFIWSHYGDEQDLNIGVGKVFWGVTESRHLVDIINQIDSVEDIDDEARLGQMMINTRHINDWGTVDVFLLPAFRERKFSSDDTRPRAELVIDNGRSIYQDSDKKEHIDWAARWSHSLADLDIGVSVFKGTQRDPLLLQADNSLIPVYVQTRQIGIDAQYIYEDWLFKFEGVSRDSHDVNFNDLSTNALVSGFEYTTVGIFDSRYDLGIIGEYLYDEWHDLTALENDWMSGLRWVFNDEFDTEILLSHIIDVDKHSQLWLLSAERRLNDQLTIELTARWVSDVANDDNALQTYKQEDLIDLKLSYYF